MLQRNSPTAWSLILSVLCLPSRVYCRRIWESFCETERGKAARQHDKFHRTSPHHPLDTRWSWQILCARRDKSMFDLEGCFAIWIRRSRVSRWRIHHSTAKKSFSCKLPFGYKKFLHLSSYLDARLRWAAHCWSRIRLWPGIFASALRRRDGHNGRWWAINGPNSLSYHPSAFCCWRKLRQKFVYEK